ncbi:lethal(3)malignant brain tumor-like protein 3 [Trichonephila clavata]|uniref:Lethal(3)malignant brain tumor-like protein 3 n=1 Tax=Trichonephila clavata TaxID=2740835 RepID=A0A8X6JL49_TRICU|nr:lethal(3)malignant brain tumor-like protein 3 [Trichonephila clavata]
MALAAPSSSVASTSASCLPPQLPLISLRETVAKINMPAVVQSPAVNSQISLSSTTVSNEPVYNLTISNGEIINTASTSTVPKIAVPSVTALAVPRDFKTDPVTTTSQKPIIVTVSGMSGMTAGKHVNKHMTSATNVLTAPILSAPVHIVPQHFTTDKLPTMSRVTTNINPVLSAKPRQTPHITPLLPGSILTSKGQLVIASANSPMIGSSAASVITTMSSISLSSSIVTVTPVIMTSTAPLVTLSGNLNQVTQAQILSSIISSTVKPALTPNNKTIVPTAYLKPVNIAANPASFPVAVQPATIAPAAIALATSPIQQQQPVPQMTATIPQLQPAKDPEIEAKTDKAADFDPIKAMVWKDGVGELPGSDLKFKVTEFGTLELIGPDDIPNTARAVRDESTATVEDGSTESRQKATKNKEMYQDENSIEKVSQNGAKDPNMSEELCRCENCDCFGLKIEFCKSGRFCSQSCVSAYANKRNTTWLKRGISKEKFKRKKLKTEQMEENGIKNEGEEDIKSEEMESEELPEVKKEERIPKPKKKEFCWEEYLKQENAVSAPVKLFKEFQTYPANGNGFVKDMKLEGIDPKHPSLFCVLTVSETKGYRVRLHFDGYSECYDFWVNANSPDIFPVGWCEKTNHQLQPPKGFTIQDFDWNGYLKASQAEAAPKQLFSWKSQPNNSGFKRGMKLEAVDKKNSSLVCVATITDVMDNRFLIHFDGWEDVYDYWADGSSPHLHPVNWCKDNNRVLTPPKDTKENVTFSWTKYLADTRSTAVHNKSFKPCPPNEFKVGMKLEAVDKRNPGLIRVATIADKTDHNLLIHFDGWSSMYDYWVDDNSPDIHPIHWCAKTGHPLEPPLVITSDQTGPCPTTGCLGQGHIKGPKYTSHHSAFGCPYSPINLNKIDTIGQDRVIITKESLNEFTKKISDQGGATDGLRRCPTPGCNGVGHVKGKYSVHHRISGCPLAEKNALKLQQNSSATSNPSASRTPTPPPSIAATSSNNGDTKNLENMKTRNGVGRGKKKFKVAGTGLRGRPPKHLTALKIEALKKVKEAKEKKIDLEEKIHDSVFNPPFVTPPKELPLSWEHNTQLIPGLSSIKGSAARQWSVNQVAKFVSSLKGCTDHGKIFREQLIDGEALLELTQSDLLDILHLKLGPALKVYSSIIAFKESEKFE